MKKKIINQYISDIWKMSGLERELPFPDAEPLFGDSGEQLANRKVADELMELFLGNKRRSKPASQKPE